jgi:hypothetical protein
MEKYSNSVLEKELEKANEEIEKFPDEDPIDIQELAKIKDEIYQHPSRNTDIIREMRCRL